MKPSSLDRGDHSLWWSYAKINAPEILLLLLIINVIKENKYSFQIVSMQCKGARPRWVGGGAFREANGKACVFNTVVITFPPTTSWFPNPIYSSVSFGCPTYVFLLMKRSATKSLGKSTYMRGRHHHGFQKPHFRSILSSMIKCT